MWKSLTMANERPDDVASDERSRGRLSTKTKVIAGGVAAVVVIVGFLILKRFLPQWWGVGISHRVDGSFGRGCTYGLVFGLGGVALALIFGLVAILSFRRGTRNIPSLVCAVLAFAVLIPNLLTLAVVTGSSSAERAGQAALDYNGAGFRGATLVGAILGVAIGLIIDFYILRTRRSRNAKKAA